MASQHCLNNRSKNPKPRLVRGFALWGNLWKNEFVQTEKLLALDCASVNYGGIQALDKVSVTVDEGEIVALMGPNGAGKSTILKAIFGLIGLTHGQVKWHDMAVIPTPMTMVKRGIAFVPQGRRVFTHLTVEENLEIGGYTVTDQAELKRRINEVMEEFPMLKQKRYASAGTLSGGQQQMLAIARGLMVDPRVLLLDEPSLGLDPKMVKTVFAKIKEINEKHKTAIVVVEHNLQSLLSITDRAYVLDKGQIVVEDTAQNIVSSGILEKVFLAHR